MSTEPIPADRPPQSAPGPLAGVRVLDFGIYASVPYAATFLGDMGADVIKVEAPRLDPFRYIDHGIAPNRSAYYFGVNRSKRGLVLDLTHPDSRPVLHQLIRSAAVVLVSFRPEVLAKLGLAYEQVIEVNERIVYGCLTAYGETGPRSDEPGMDLLAQAVSGIMGVTGQPGGEPTRTGPPVGDFYASMLMLSGVLAALRVSERDGTGQKVSVNLLDGGLALMPNFVTPYMKTGEEIKPVGNAHPQVVPYQAFLAADKWFVLACPSNNFWPAVCKVSGCEDWLDDERVATNSGRVKHRDEVISRLAAVFRDRPAAEWLTALKAAGVPCAPVNSLGDAINDPQARHNQAITQLHHPRHGPYHVVQNPIRLSRTPVAARIYATDPGEHSAEVLAEVGLDPETIEKLLEGGVVA